jgi:hypothetical protein
VRFGNYLGGVVGTVLNDNEHLFRTEGNRVGVKVMGLGVIHVLVKELVKTTGQQLADSARKENDNEENICQAGEEDRGVH